VDYDHEVGGGGKRQVVVDCDHEVDGQSPSFSRSSWNSLFRAAETFFWGE